MKQAGKCGRKRTSSRLFCSRGHCCSGQYLQTCGFILKDILMEGAESITVPVDSNNNGRACSTEPVCTVRLIFNSLILSFFSLCPTFTWWQMQPVTLLMVSEIPWFEKHYKRRLQLHKGSQDEGRLFADVIYLHDFFKFILQVLYWEYCNYYNNLS